MSVDLNKIADQIVNLSVKDVQSLAKILKEEHGIEPASAAPVMVAPSADAGAPAEEKSDFDVVLTAFKDGSKIALLKLVRTKIGVDLKEAMAIFKTLPSKINKSPMGKQEAEELKKELEAAGATIELK